MVGVGLFDSLRRRGKGGSKGGGKPGTLRKSTPDDTRHLDEWAAARNGVEAYVEPRTTVTETTVVLIAHDGEWTRRRIGSLDAAQQFGKKRSIPVYEVSKVGYPKRMREYTERQKRRPGS
ncbi:oxidoreductase [Amycolatopsis sp. 195334CR]|uniref:oxidoreductase n=1 Tax=Amycolatopsis sp. 195334CR TaxID=2814588 RepID=UPI001A8C517D|nr:oxidoreductase [Amycolatopsis sp. 195334CR]MBN6041808.1 oxidoreductase [Amycolatopsis sp. 195334CR]